MRRYVFLSLLGLSVIHAFLMQSRCHVRQGCQQLFASVNSDIEPQVFASGYSQAIEMTTALQEAVGMALEALPSAAFDRIDLAIVSVSSLYDGNSRPSDVVPTVLEAAPGIQNLIGCTNGGFISSLANLDYTPESPACRPIEREGVPGVTVTLMILPDVSVSTFHVLGDDIADKNGTTSSADWKASVGLRGLNKDPSSLALIFPSPAFQPALTDLLRGLERHVTPTIVGAIASTVSSLSRARLFRYSKEDGACVQTLADGCVGAVLDGDIQMQMMVAQGAKPVGGVYQIVKGQDSTIAAIALDEVATEKLRKDEGAHDDEGEDRNVSDEARDETAKLAQAYAKARIPKPVLAEANLIMKTLSDDDQAFMRTALLGGLERAGGRTLSDLVRLAEGKGPGFIVHQVASAGLKDGSVTFGLGVVNITVGQRFRFYVRDAAFAQKEARAIWGGYKRRLFSQVKKDEDVSSFTPTGCFVFPTLDRGNKLFPGKSGFESETVIEYVPTIPSISGFFGNGVIGRLHSDPESGGREQTSLSGSASGYLLFGSKTGRPIYIPSKATAEGEQSIEEKASKKAEDEHLEAAKAREARMKSFEVASVQAPRDESGELILRRREVHSGRAMTVSTVQWSVADKIASPTSVFEGYMWDKETEVDRFRERVPLSNLVSQCRLSAGDPSQPKTRDWLGSVKDAAKGGAFVIIPECKRIEPATGSLRKRYDIAKLTKEFTVAGVPAISVNCDGILFGGTLDDVTKARDSTTAAAAELRTSKESIVVPPILASDLLLYPYQLYKLKLAGADAVNLMVAALEAKDLVYLAKIAASLQIQTFVTVTSSKQIQDLSILPPGSVKGLIVSNRKLEDFTFDLSGQQALDILTSDTIMEFRAKHGDDNIAILVEGRVGLVTSEEGASPLDYIKRLKEAGAIGAIVGAGLVPVESGNNPLATLLQMSYEIKA